MTLSVKDAAAISRMAAALAPHVTGSIIDDIASHFGFRRAMGSNKTAKIGNILQELVADGRSRATAGDVVTNLVMAAHHRTVAGSAQLTVNAVDRLCADLNSIGISPGELAHKGWRAGLAPPAESPKSTPPRPPPQSQLRERARPQPLERHEHALRYLVELSMNGVSPQRRGTELEKIVEDVMRRELLVPARNIVNPGEQLDLAFQLDGQHYLMECRWHLEPQGAPAVRELSAKVARKAEGTFGVLLSMSGFAENINTTASLGSRLNCVGLTFRELMRVLEASATLADEVRHARRTASRRSLFYDPE
jgi:hypothetical protein